MKVNPWYSDTSPTLFLQSHVQPARRSLKYFQMIQDLRTNWWLEADPFVVGMTSFQLRFVSYMDRQRPPRLPGITSISHPKVLMDLHHTPLFPKERVQGLGQRGEEVWEGIWGCGRFQCCLNLCLLCIVYLFKSDRKKRNLFLGSLCFFLCDADGFVFLQVFNVSYYVTQHICFGQVSP